MAALAVRPYLRYAYDPASGRYFSQVGLCDGKPVRPASPGYWPRFYADFWNTDQWPTHDYPAAVFEAALSLYTLTGEEVFAEHARRGAAATVRTRPRTTGR
jgi:hypothetical protein